MSKKCARTFPSKKGGALLLGTALPIGNYTVGQFGVSSNIAQNHSFSPYEVISDHYLPQFTYKVDQK